MTELSQLDELEVLHPELSTDTVTLVGVEFKIMPLMLKSEAAILKLLGPLADDTSYDIMNSGVVAAFQTLSKEYDTLLEMTAIILSDAGSSLTKETLAESRTLTVKDLYAFVLAYVSKTVTLGDKLASFFLQVFKSAENQLQRATQILHMAEDTASAISSSDYVENTVTPLNTALDSAEPESTSS